MLDHENCAGPCAAACKPGAGTDAQDGTFDHILVAAAEHADREAGLPGRADRMIACRSCGAETQSSDVCPACAEALHPDTRVCGVAQCPDLVVTTTKAGKRHRVCNAADGAAPGKLDRCPTGHLDKYYQDANERFARAMREERAAALGERCRIHRVRYVDDLPVHVLEEMQRGRC